METKETIYYGYLRISTKRQAARKGKLQTDLSLSQETQLQLIKDFIQSKNGKLIDYEVETESGTNPDRPVYRRVVNTCKIKGYTLITAYLDRLHRNVEAMARLMNSGIDFIFCDFPTANRFTIHILSAIAEYQSTNTREKINATIENKRRMKIAMGDHPNSVAALERSRNPEKARAARANKAYWNAENIAAGDTVIDKRGQGWTYKRIADHLNAKGWLTRRGKMFTQMTVKLLLERYSILPIEKELQKRNANLKTIKP